MKNGNDKLELLIKSILFYIILQWNVFITERKK